MDLRVPSNGGPSQSAISHSLSFVWDAITTSDNLLLPFCKSDCSHWASCWLQALQQWEQDQQRLEHDQLQQESAHASLPVTTVSSSESEASS